MKKLSILALALLVFAFNASVLAQDEEEARDVMELCIQGGFAIPSGGLSDWHDSLGCKTGMSIGIDVGRFFKPELVVGLNFNYTSFGIDNPGDVAESHHRLYNPNIYMKYYLSGESDWEKYIRLYVGVENAKFMTSRPGPDPKYRATSYDAVLAAGLGLGVFRYISDYSGLYLEASYHYAATGDAKREYANDEIYEFGETTGVIGLKLGVRAIFGSDE